MSLINIFSNVWFFFANDSGKPLDGDSDLEPLTQINKIKAIHQITKVINLDKEAAYWYKPTSEFANEIKEQIEINKQKKITALFNTISSYIDKYIINPTDNLLIYTIRHPECLAALYIYYLHRKCNLTLEKAATAMTSKIVGINIIMSDELKKWLFYACSTPPTS